MNLPDPPASAPGRDIVDRLIAERAPNLVASPVGRRLLRRVLCPILSCREAVALAELVRSMPGRAIFPLLEELLEIRTRVSGLEHVPAKGPVILVDNHPTGLADGIAVAAALRARRDDLRFLAEADALRVAPGLAEPVVPVEWVQAERSRAEARELPAAVGRLPDEGGALVLFPAGRISCPSRRGLTERPRQPAAVGLARRFSGPIVPMRLRTRNSTLFYEFSQVSRELRDITPFDELLDERGRIFDLQLVAPLDRTETAGEPLELAVRLQRFVERSLRDRGLLRPPPSGPSNRGGARAPAVEPPATAVRPGALREPSPGPNGQRPASRPRAAAPCPGETGEPARPIERVRGDSRVFFGSHASETSHRRPAEARRLGLDAGSMSRWTKSGQPAATLEGRRAVSCPVRRRVGAGPEHNEAPPRIGVPVRISGTTPDARPTVAKRETNGSTHLRGGRGGRVAAAPLVPERHDRARSVQLRRILSDIAAFPSSSHARPSRLGGLDRLAADATRPLATPFSLTGAARP